MNKQLDRLEKARLAVKARIDAGKTIERLNPVEKANKNPRSLRLAINGKCWDCTCGQRVEITNCPMTDCTLYPVRPYSKKS